MQQPDPATDMERELIDEILGQLTAEGISATPVQLLEHGEYISAWFPEITREGALTAITEDDDCHDGLKRWLAERAHENQGKLDL